MFEVQRILQGVVATLEQSVLPELQTGFARGQLWSVIDILENLGARIDWGGQRLEMENEGLTKLAAEIAPAMDDDALRSRLDSFAEGAATSSSRSLEGRALLSDVIASGAADEGKVRESVDGFLANDAFLGALTLVPSRLAEISKG